MKSKADTVVYPVFWENNQAAYFAKWLYFDSCDVEVVADTTFSAARKYLRNGNEQKRVAVLNFANPHYAGGGVEHGAMAQEECCAVVVICIHAFLHPVPRRSIINFIVIGRIICLRIEWSIRRT